MERDDVSVAKERGRRRDSRQRNDEGRPEAGGSGERGGRKAQERCEERKRKRTHGHRGRRRAPLVEVEGYVKSRRRGETERDGG